MSISRHPADGQPRAAGLTPLPPSPGAGWPEMDASLLEDRRAAVPPFPVDLLPEPWRGWVSDTARGAGAPVDHVAQAVLAAVAGLCGAGASVRLTGAWSEPLVLWQAVVGGPSSGKSRALAPVRRLLASIEAEWQAGDGEGKGSSQFVAADPSVEAIAGIVSTNPRGVILWRDELSAWFAALGHAGNDGDNRALWLEAWAADGVTVHRRGSGKPLHLGNFPVSVLGTIQPERLAKALQDDDGRVAARLLYAWPSLPLYCPLDEGAVAGDDDALKMLRRIARKARTPDDPLVLAFDAHAVKAFNGFLGNLHAELRHTDGPAQGGAEGLEAGWLGRGGGTVARLAGALEMLAWSGTGSIGLPGQIGQAQVDAAARLWSDYFKPHARAVFGHAGPTDLERQVRRVVRWLKEGGRAEVSREDIRREALARSVNARETDLVIGRLAGSGILRFVAGESSPLGGPRVRRWQVNPALAHV